MASSVINTNNPNNIPIIDAAIKDAESQIIAAIQNIYKDGRNIPTSNEIIYVPIIFSVLYNPDRDNSGITEEIMDDIYLKAVNLIENVNSIFAGTNTNNAYGGGNVDSILNNPDHGVTSNVRFFLPHKIPKEYLYPFYPSNIVGPLSSSLDLSSVENFKNSFGFGISNIPTTEGLPYTSPHTYEDVKNQRALVKELYAQSLTVEENTPEPEQENTNSSAARAQNVNIHNELQSNKELLEQMEDSYFFFFGSRPGLIFVRRFNDDEGFGASTGYFSESYQMNAIRNIEHGSTPTHHPLNDRSACGKLFENFAPQTFHVTPSSGLFSNLPFLKINSTVKTGSWSNQFLGATYNGGHLENDITATQGIMLHSMRSMQYSTPQDLELGGSSGWSRDTYSVFGHEFFHQLGYDHVRNGFSMTGLIDFEGPQLNCYGRKKSDVRQLYSHYDKFYMPFEPPFIYYDPYNPNHDLENEDSLPDTSIINADEKKYVETIINHVIPTGTSNFATKVGFNLSSSMQASGLTRFAYQASIGAGSSGYSGAPTNLGHAELFGMVSHLPTFWGGSYTINEDGTKSMLINATHVTAESSAGETAGEFVMPEIGDTYGGGVVAHISDTKIYIVQKESLFTDNVSGSALGQMGPNTGDWPKFSKDLDSGRANTQGWVDFIISKGYEPSGYAPYNALNLTMEGYSDWYIPTVELLLAMSNNFSNINLFNSDIEWLGDEYNNYNSQNLTLGSRLATSSREDLNGAEAASRRYATVKPGNATISQKVELTTWIWTSTKKYLLFREETIPGTEETGTPEVNLNRVGPNITVYNPVCLEDENGERTKVNWALPFTLEWYNSNGAFPAFPDNTRVEDMFSPDLCPCLYETQTLNIATSWSQTTSPSYDITLFQALIDENTGETITTTTGTPVKSEGSMALSEYIKESVVPVNCGSSPEGQTFFASMFGGSIARGNVGTNFAEYFGDEDHDIVWLKQSGNIVLPNFPVYVGFMPESPLPGFIRFDSSKFNSSDLQIGGYEDKTAHNDPSIYSTWGQQFYSIIDKYLRSGSYNPNDANYNPFKINTSAAGIDSAILSFFNSLDNIQDWVDYKYYTKGHATGAATYTAAHPLTDFFKRKLPNEANPALDDLPDTIYGPINQNTFTNIMFYETTFTEPKLPTPSMMNRLNFLLEDHDEAPTEGLYAVMKTFVNDLYDPGYNYSNILPDYAQRIRSNDEINTYIATALDYIETQKIDASTIVYGCMNQDALNYDPNATYPDDSCIEKVFGCMDQEAVTYNPDANVDDGSCEYYSLTPTPVVPIPICPAEIVSACNNDTSGFTPLNLFPGISEAGIQDNPAFAETIAADINIDFLSDVTLNSMVTYGNNSWGWNNPGKLALLNSIRFGPGINGCTNPFGTETEGALNVGGGCVNYIDFTQCVYPTVNNYQCDMIGEVTGVSPIGSTPGSVIFSEAGNIPFTELSAYFSEVSSLGYTIGVCNENEKLE